MKMCLEGGKLKINFGLCLIKKHQKDTLGTKKEVSCEGGVAGTEQMGTKVGQDISLYESILS